MAITVQCPNSGCSASSVIADSFSGRKVRCKKCNTPFVVQPTFDGQQSDTQKSHPSANANPFPVLPAEFGRYRVLKLLGRGGMGAVYLADDTQLGRQVALKIPFFDAKESPQRIERFAREARSAAVLAHPNICTVFDSGQIDGRPFITMALISGSPLETEIGRGPIAEPRAAEIAFQVAEALGYAHGKGTVHRDLKPANIMIAADGEPVVMDFGLAKQLLEIDPNEAKLSRDGGLLGTPSYMSPEQVKGEIAAIGPATDIYSLGVVLFEMLTGSTPYSGSMGAVLGQILGAPVPPLSEFYADADPRLEVICRKAMAKDPSDRFQAWRSSPTPWASISRNPVRHRCLRLNRSQLPLRLRSSPPFTKPPHRFLCRCECQHRNRSRRRSRHSAISTTKWNRNQPQRNPRGKRRAAYPFTSVSRWPWPSCFRSASGSD